MSSQGSSPDGCSMTSSTSSASLARQAEMRKDYLRRCAEIGIDTKEAQKAEAECKSWYMNWWLGRRMNKASSTVIPGSDNDSEEVADYDDASSSSATMKSGGSGCTDDDRSMCSSSTVSSQGLRFPLVSKCPDLAARQIECMKMSLLSVLKEDDAVAKGRDNNPRFMTYVEFLANAYSCRRNDDGTRSSSFDAAASMMDNTTWVMLQPSPQLQERLGRNARGDPTYTLGRMSFDMFRPTDLVCSLQWTFNTVAPVGIDNDDKDDRPRSVPKSIRSEVYRLQKQQQQKHPHQQRSSPLRTYDISTAFTVEPQPNGDESDKDQPPLRGLMTTFGYVLPDPNEPDRFTVWFTGGLLEPVVEPSSSPAARASLSERWRRVFGNRDDDENENDEGRSERRAAAAARVLAARLLLGADVPDAADGVDGSMEYRFHRPVGGRGRTHVDVLYVDHNLRILRGNHGTVYVSGRVDANRP